MTELAKLSTDQLVKELTSRQKPKPAAQQKHETRLAELRDQIDAAELATEKARIEAVRRRASTGALAFWRRERQKLQELKEERDDLAAILEPEPAAPEPMPPELRSRLQAAREASKTTKARAAAGSNRDQVKAHQASRELKRLEREASAYASE